MSPRAAWPLESLGFTNVHEYRPGKADWSAAGLPMEGMLTVLPRLGQLARKDVTRAGLSDLVGDVAQRAEAEGWDTALVVNDEGILLGRLFKTELEGESNVTAEAVMQHGPSGGRGYSKCLNSSLGSIPSRCGNVLPIGLPEAGVESS